MQEVLKRASAYFARGQRPPKLIDPVGRDLARDGISVATACRGPEVPTSGYDKSATARPATRARTTARFEEPSRKDLWASDAEVAEVSGRRRRPGSWNTGALAILFAHIVYGSP